jgi:cytochrome b561
MAPCMCPLHSARVRETVNNRPRPTSRVAAFNAYLFLVFLFYALVIIGVSYILIRVYRERTRKVRKLR